MKLDYCNISLKILSLICFRDLIQTNGELAQ